jgi:hypothetical protein
MKTREEMRRKAGEMQIPLVEFFRRHLSSGYGDEVEQLRLVGYVCEAMMRMVEEELVSIKMQGEADSNNRGRSK